MGEKPQKSTVNKTLFWVILAALVVLSFFILKPFLIALVSAFVLAYLARPVYIRLQRVSNPHLAAFLTIILLLGVIIIPIVLLTASLIGQAQDAFSTPGFESTVEEKIKALPIFETLNIDVEKARAQVLEVLINAIKTTLVAIPSVILSILITLLAIYYMLIRWDSLVLGVKNFIPFSNKERLSTEIASATKHIIYGYLLIAFMEFIVSSIGFYIAGIKSYLILAALISILAFVPGLGPGIIWIPTALLKLATGDYTAAIIVIITGLIISIAIETFLLPRIVGKKAAIHPLILLIGILGGVPLFGIFGFIIGPIVLAYTIKILEQAIKKPD